MEMYLRNKDKEIKLKKHSFFVKSSIGIILSGISTILFFLPDLVGKTVLGWTGLIPFSVAIVLGVLAFKEQKREQGGNDLVENDRDKKDIHVQIIVKFENGEEICLNDCDEEVLINRDLLSNICDGQDIRSRDNALAYFELREYDQNQNKRPSKVSDVMIKIEDYSI